MPASRASSLAGSRNTNGSIGQTIYRDSTFNNFNGPLPPVYPNLLPPSETGGTPDHPSVSRSTPRISRTRARPPLSLGVDREILPGIWPSLKYNQSQTEHLTRFVDRNAAELGAPWSTGIGARDQRHQRSHDRRVHRAEPVLGMDLGVNKRFENNWGFQAYYTYSKDKSDDDNERDPFTFRYAKIFEDPSDPTAEFGREWGYSDRDQRHRLNAYLLWRAPADVDVSFRYAYRSAQPLDVTAAGVPTTTPQDRINPDGTVIHAAQSGTKGQSAALRFRPASRTCLHFGSLGVEPGIDVFNVFNARTSGPAVTNLVFNFDGTVQEGVGDPRQVQIGARVLF